MDSYRVSAGRLLYGEQDLGPSTSLYADKSNAETYKGENIVQRQMPERVDFIFCVGDKVVGIESKTPQDLISSHIARRLQRQLHTLVMVTDIPSVMLRGMDSFYNMDDYPEVQYDLFKLQLVGGVLPGRGPGYLLIAPSGSPIKFLGEVKETLNGQRNLLTTVAGRDILKPRGGKRERSLQRSIPGVGPKTARELAKFGNLAKVLTAGKDELKAVGMNKRVLDGIEEANT